VGYSPNTVYVDIVLVAHPPDGLKGFSQLCKVLQLFAGYTANATELYKQAKTLPCTILENVYFGTADNVVKRLTATGIIKLIERHDVIERPTIELIIPDEAKHIPDLPKQLIEFISHNICIDGIGLLPLKYANVKDFNSMQSGYRFDALVGEYLVSDKKGGWQKSWYVFAANYFDDPFYIDFAESDIGFPVYFSQHGEGKWTQNKIADSIEHFEHILRKIKGIESQMPFNLTSLSLGIDLNNEFWAEVVENCNDAGLFE
jgi:hypothetical protein